VITEEVIKAAQDAEKNWKVPASVTIAQYGLESGWGKHMPSGSNNPFGIKASKGIPSVLVSTHEFIHGRFVVVKAPFRVFKDLSEAFDYHAKLLATGTVYKPAMSVLPDADLFVTKMAKVYATDPNYAKTLLEIINEDNLNQYNIGAK
jgi:flagellum-specific peptidoglycan hydrolase FlgJ